MTASDPLDAGIAVEPSRVLVVGRSASEALPVFSSAEVGQIDAAELDANLAAAYDAMQSGEQLLLDFPATSSSATAGSFPGRDRIGTALHRAGFAETRFHRTGARQIVQTTRSADLPPPRRATVLSVVMPVYDERASVAEVIDTLLAKHIDGVEIRLLIVESNSSDGSREIVRSYEDHPRVRIVLEDRPEGKGHAVRAGLAAADGDFVLIQDADLEYDLDDYEKLLEPLRRFEVSFVLGERMRTHGARFGVRYFEKELLASKAMNVGNFAFLHLFNLVYGTRLADPFTMYKVFRRDCLTGVRLESNRFDFDWEIVGKLVRLGYVPKELPVHYHSRPFAEGKKIRVFRDPITWIRACFKYRFAPLGD